MDTGRLPDFTSGESYRQQVTITDGDDVPIDLTTYTLFFTLKKDVELDDAEAAIAATLQNDPDQVTNPGVSLLDLAPVQTTINPGTYWYDLKIVSAAGDAEFLTLPNSQLRVNPAVTRRVAE